MSAFRPRRVTAVFALTLALAAAGPAAALDCDFFEEQAYLKDETDYSVRMLDACRALATYRDRLIVENVRYAFGERVVNMPPEAVARRAAPLDTFHVLPDMTKYRIARESGVFRAIHELPPR